MTNSMAIGITNPAGNLGGHQDHGKEWKQGRGMCVLVHPVRRWSQEVDYLLVVESDECGDSANQDERNIVP